VDGVHGQGAGTSRSIKRRRLKKFAEIRKKAPNGAFFVCDYYRAIVDRRIGAFYSLRVNSLTTGVFVDMHQNASCIRPLILMLSVTCFPMLSAADSESLVADEPQKGFLTRSFHSAEQTRDNWSERWAGFAEGVDSYFSEEDAPPDYKNESYVKLQFKQSWAEHGEVQNDVRVKAKFDLPNTQRKMKLFFSSADDTENSIEERVRSNSTGERISRKDSVSGIELTPDSEWHRWKRSARVGIKLRTPLVTFGRYRLSRPFESWGAWEREFKQEVSYYSDRGWSESSEFEMRRQLDVHSSLRYWTVLEFEDRNDFFQNVHLLSLTKALSERTAVDYRVGLVFSTEYKPELAAYLAGLSYSYKLYEDWVFVTASPEVYFPKTDNWNPEATFTIKMDIYFSR
jgi:hypothetical protein